MPIAKLSVQSAAQQVLGAALRMEGGDVHLCNAYSLSLAERDSDYRLGLQGAFLNLPDGMSVVWASRVLRATPPLKERVYGPTLFLDVVRLGQQSHLKHYLYGATDDVLAKLRAELQRHAPDAEFVASEAPPFRPLTQKEERDLATRVSQSGAHIVWVGLGTPKQDWFGVTMRNRVPAVTVAVGAAFEFIPGLKPQAPQWMQLRGLEWAFRLMTEPRRLWRRYLIGNSAFLFAVLRQRVREG